VSTATNNDFPTKETDFIYNSVTSSGRGNSEEESIKVRDLKSRIKIVLHLQSGKSIRDSKITYNHRINQKVRIRKLDLIFFPEVFTNKYVHYNR